MPCFQIKDEKDDGITEIHEKVKSRNYKINTVVKTKRKTSVPECLAWQRNDRDKKPREAWNIKPIRQ